jgi:hypothetical protein
MHFFEATQGRAHAIKQIFFAGFPFFTSKLNYCRVTGPQNKIFIKNQLTLVDTGPVPAALGTGTVKFRAFCIVKIFMIINTGIPGVGTGTGSSRYRYRYICKIFFC